MNYDKTYDRLISAFRGLSKEEAKTAYGYVENHHIFPSCLGGSDEPDNMVYLPAKAHFLAHHLLTKIYPGAQGTWWAYHGMLHRRGDRDYRVTSRMYQTLRENLYRLGRDEETKQKISETMTGRILGPQSEEHRAKIASSHLGKKKPRSPDWQKKLNHANTGKKRTPEQRARMSEAIRAAFAANPRPPMSDEHRLKISAGGLGKKRPLRSQEHALSISKSLVGKVRGPRDPEIARKISESLKVTLASNGAEIARRKAPRGPQSELTKMRKRIAWMKRKGLQPTEEQLKILSALEKP